MKRNVLLTIGGLRVVDGIWSEQCRDVLFFVRAPSEHVAIHPRVKPFAHGCELSCGKGLAPAQIRGRSDRRGIPRAPISTSKGSM